MNRWMMYVCILSCTTSEVEVGKTRQPLGEPTDGFPSWSERVVHVWTNRARADPATDLADCTVCAEKDCYTTPVAPVLWNHNLARAARFHSDNLSLGGCRIQHDSPCTLIDNLNSQYDPGSCDGSPSCACEEGELTCGASTTSWSARVRLFGTAPNAENVASGRSDPVRTFYQWFHEPDDNSSCGFRTENGHRYNIVNGNLHSLGVGKAKSASVWTQDFSNVGSPSGIVGGVHYPETGSTLEFRANWYAENPMRMEVNIDGVCSNMTLERGTAQNGTYLATVNGLSGCNNYVFHAIDASGADIYFPSSGSFRIGCSEDWHATRPTDCAGGCTPDCSGRECGDDGCGGVCGSCDVDETCSEGTCTCSLSICDGSCVDTPDRSTTLRHLRQRLPCGTTMRSRKLHLYSRLRDK